VGRGGTRRIPGKTARVPMKFVLKGGETRRRGICWDKSEEAMVSRMMRKGLCWEMCSMVLSTRYFLSHIVFHLALCFPALSYLIDIQGHECRSSWVVCEIGMHSPTSSPYACMSRIPSSIGTTSKRLREAKELVSEPATSRCEETCAPSRKRRSRVYCCGKVCTARVNSWPLNAIHVLPSLPLGSCPRVLRDLSQHFARPVDLLALGFLRSAPQAIRILDLPVVQP
jgi:hypothetical protein